MHGNLIFESIINLILFPKGNNRQHEHLANAGKIKIILTKIHQLSPKRQIGCPKKDIVL